MKYLPIILGGFITGIIISLIINVYTNNPIEDKIDAIREKAELAHHYCYLSEKEYCVANVKRIDSLYRVIDRMLRNPNLDNEYQIELIDIRRDLIVPRSISNTQLTIHEFDSIYDQWEREHE